MSDAQVRRLPVIDDQERLCGIVSLGDLSQQADEDSAEQALEGVPSPAASTSSKPVPFDKLAQHSGDRREDWLRFAASGDQRPAISPIA